MTEKIAVIAKGITMKRYNGFSVSLLPASLSPPFVSNGFSKNAVLIIGKK